jgi:hypothetical protein
MPQGQRERVRRGTPRCAFCGRARGEVSYLHVEREFAVVCNGCVYDAKATRNRGPGKARTCSFCGAEEKDRDWIFGGNLVAICNDCIDRCVEEMAGD